MSGAPIAASPASSRSDVADSAGANPASASDDARVRIYGLAQCDTCRKARRWLERAGIAHEFQDYRAEPIAGETLKTWAAQSGWDALINRASTTWRSLPPARKSAGNRSDAEWVLLLRDHPALLKRPVVCVTGEPATFGFSDNAFKRIFAQ